MVVTQTELTDKGGVYEVEVIGHGTHFSETAPRCSFFAEKVR